MIKYIQIFGERCSGTKYLARLIDRNFEGVSLTKSFGCKHWFIKNHFPRGKPNTSTDYECIRTLTDSDDTLFVVIYRNPFDYLRSLHLKPYHAPNHFGLTFSKFIRKKWVSYETSQVNKLWPHNDQNYYFIEEADNIIQLRTQKILHFNNLKNVVKNVRFINYEKLVRDIRLLKHIADELGIRFKQIPLDDEKTYYEGGQKKTFVPTRYASISQLDFLFIAKSLDWKVERSINYSIESYWK